MNAHPTLACILLTLCMWSPALQAQMNEPAQSAAADTSYTTVAGDTLEKIARKHYAGSPLEAGLLMRHLQAANAEVLGKTPSRQRIKTGTVLRLPEHARLVQLSLAPFLPPPLEAQHSGHSPEARRRWVHYP